MLKLKKHYFDFNDVQKCMNVIKAIEKYYKFMAKTNLSCIERSMFIKSTQQKNALKAEASRHPASKMNETLHVYLTSLVNLKIYGQSTSR